MTAIRWIWRVLRTENLRSFHRQTNENKSQKVCGAFSFKNYVQIECFAILRKQSALFGQKPRRLAFLLTISQKKAKTSRKNQNQ